MSEKLRREMLPILVDRLPDFNAHWPKEWRDRWFVWFFTLLVELHTEQLKPREAVAGDFGIQEPQP